MWIKQIEYDGGLDYKGKIIFDRKSIISSKYNKKGKSTLLRVILYALGFEVVRTNGIANLDLKTNIKILTDDLEEIQIFRNNEKVILEESSSDRKRELHLPEDQEVLQSTFFDFNNGKLLENFLGTFYFEQGRGYSLINNGVVTPKNRFNLKELVTQLVPEVEEKLKEIEKKEITIRRNKAAINAINAVLKDNDNFIEEDNQDEITIQNINSLKFKLKQLKRKKRTILESIEDNNKLLEYIGKLKLRLRLSDKSVVVVTSDKIEGMENISNYLISEKTVVNNQIKETKQLIYKNEEAIKKKYTNRDIAKFSIPQAFNFEKNKAMLKYLNKQDEELALQKKELLRKNSYQELQDRIYKLYTEYASELNISNWLKNGIFSSKNISGLTGTEQEFTAISIRLAALKLIEEFTKVNLPIILDSPFQELDTKNKKLLVDFLENEFSEKHQFIITSVNKEIPNDIYNHWQIITLD
ncbi:hypothetical protein A3P32_07980 [Lactobacillus johnsonii]|uniref:hypothetical protein n=1 Tax=Lactobacillus TaxID=1578 RepID=UPI000B3FF2BF|nr:MULTISPECIES: hypothetical protein [Lactobacillus]ARW74864.1 hypothetical protein A3P31_04570 [Lactobacillus johnsonii]ARW77176.1 hypothetical protein A3P32_07980 [Lactobacillus johnsonii]PEG76931.1 hypothetical protein CP370_07535 [Lactobacillus sp. UMNPBX19]